MIVHACSMLSAVICSFFSSTYATVLVYNFQHTCCTVAYAVSQCTDMFVGYSHVRYIVTCLLFRMVGWQVSAIVQFMYGLVSICLTSSSQRLINTVTNRV